MTAPPGLLPTRWTEGRWPLLVSLGAVAVVIGIVVLRLTTNLVDPGVAEGAGGDFRDATYFPVQALLDGVNPYDPEEYLAHDPAIGQYFPAYGPHHLLIHLPLAVLSLNAAMTVYAILTLALTGLLAWVSLRMAGIAASAAVVLGTFALILASNAGRANFVNLQPTILVVLGIYLALSDRQRPWVRALGLALSSIKPQFGVPLMLIMLVTDRRHIVWRGVALTALASAPILLRLIDIEGGLLEVVRTFGDNLSFAGDVGRSNLQIDLLGSLRISSVVATVAVAAVIVGGAALVLRAGGRQSTPTGLVVLTGAILLTLFHVNYDLLLLAWPILAVAAATQAGGEVRHLRWLLLALLVLVFNPLTSSFMIDGVGPAGPLGALSAITLAGTVVGAAALHLQDQRSTAHS